MATSKDYLDYLLERLGNNPDVRIRPMMGEYLLYFRDKLVADICDNRLLIKPVSAVKELVPETEMQPPYDGAKPHIYIEDIDDGEFVLKLFETAYANLPAPKPKKKKA
ncbi:MAG: competence protein TfoX [Clostridia bacterium]|nr:competence protein TfoX [Clostridia bacterium]